MRNLRLYLESTVGLDATNKLFDDIEKLILHSLRSVQNVMINDRMLRELDPAITSTYCRSLHRATTVLSALFRCAQGTASSATAMTS